MPSNSSCRHRQLSDLLGDKFSLAKKYSRSRYNDLTDYISCGKYYRPASCRNDQHDISRSSDGVGYGWSRRGRVQLEPSLLLHDPEGHLKRCYGRIGGVYHSNLAHNRQRIWNSEQLSHLDSNGLEALRYHPTAGRPFHSTMSTGYAFRKLFIRT